MEIIVIEGNERPYDSVWDMYYDEFEDLENSESKIIIQ